VWAHAAVYAVAALVAAASGFKGRSGLFVAGFLAYMAAEAPLRACDLPLVVDRFVVIGWDATFLLALAAVVRRWRVVAVACVVWPSMAAAAMLVADPVAWMSAWHVASVIASFALLMAYGREADPISVGVLATFVMIDLFIMVAQVNLEWGVLRLSTSLSPAMAIVLYAWRTIPVREG